VPRSTDWLPFCTRAGRRSTLAVMAAKGIPLESLSSFRLHSSHEEEPYQNRLAGVTRMTRQEVITEQQTITMDIEPPATTSGFIHFIQFMPLAFISLNVVFLVISVVSSFMTDHCGVGIGWHGAAIPVILVCLEVIYCACLVVLQLQVRRKMREAAHEIMHQQAQLRSHLMRVDRLDDDDLLSSPSSWFRLPRCWSSSSAFHGASDTGQVQESGYYYLPTRNEMPCHFQLLEQYYSEYLDTSSCTCAQCFHMVAGLVQVCEMSANALQPGLLRTCYGPEDETLLPGLVHQAWLSFAVLGVVGVLQSWNLRWLMMNALGTATSEKEWLAYDLLQGEHQEHAFLASIDNIEEPGWGRSTHEGAAGVLASVDQYRGRLNLTYAWMCAASAAETFGATYLAVMCNHVATQTKAMVEGSSNYKFKLRRIAEWDINKIGLVCRIVQAFFLVVASAELLGVSDIHNIWYFASGAILLGTSTATWKTLLAARYCHSQDIALGGRVLEVSATVCFMTTLTTLTWLWAVFGLFLRYATCYHGGFSVLRSLAARQMKCTLPLAR